MTETRRASGPGFWIFLYLVGTLTVFGAVLVSQTESGRVMLEALGTGSLRALGAGADGALLLVESFAAIWHEVWSSIRIG